MSIQYAGGTTVNELIAADTRLDIVDNLKLQLVAAGWSVVSGASGDWLLQSATTPAGKRIQVRLYDSGGGSASVYLRDVAGSLISAAYGLEPSGGLTYRVLANKYQFFAFPPGASVIGRFVAAGVLYIPSFMESVITDADFGWITKGNIYDTTSSLRSGTCCRVYSMIYNGVKNDLDGHPVGMLLIVATCSAWASGWATSGHRWVDDTLLISEAFLAASTDGSGSTESKIFGQLWDAIWVSQEFSDTTITFDSKTWFAVNYNNVGTNTSFARGSLCLVVPTP